MCATKGDGTRQWVQTRVYAEARRTREEVLQKEKGGWDYLPDSERLRSSNEQDALRNFEVLSEAKAQGPHCKEAVSKLNMEKRAGARNWGPRVSC